jgi:hypothetical protein
MTETAIVKSSSTQIEEYRPLTLATGKSKLPSDEEWSKMIQFAAFVWKSGIAESMSLNNEAQVVIVVMKGWELGLPPMTSLENVRIIKGRPQPSAALMESLAVARVPGARVDWTDLGENGSATCTAYRRGRQPIKITYTEADAKRAGVLGKETYQRHPAQLYRAGALRQACWLQYKEVYLGFEVNAADVFVSEIDDELDVAEKAAPTNGAAAAPPPPPAPAAPSAPIAAQPANPPGAPPAAAQAPAQPPATPPATSAPAATAPTPPAQPPAVTEPEDSALPFTKGEFLGKKLSDLKGEDFRKIVHGYQKVIARSDPADEAGLKKNTDWRDRVQKWADHRGVQIPPWQPAPPQSA